jgi:hypothetical protein
MQLRNTYPRTDLIIIINIYRYFQNVHYSVDRGMLGVQNQKDVQHLVLEYIGESIRTGSESQWDSADGLVLPVMPPTLIGSCRLLQINYVLKVTNTACDYHEQL